MADCRAGGFVHIVTNTSIFWKKGHEAQVRFSCDACGLTWFARLLPAESPMVSEVER